MTREQIAETARKHKHAAIQRLVRGSKARVASGEASKTMKAAWQDPTRRAKFLASQSSAARCASIAHARGFVRHTYSKLHQRFKQALLDAGLDSFQTECPVGWYRVDEASLQHKLAVEVDGCYWHGCPACGLDPRPGMSCLDARKNTYLRSKGWKVLRFRECQINEDMSACVAEVKEALNGSIRE